MLWKCLGQVGQDCQTDVETMGVFVVEKGHFDNEKTKKAE
jgi:hypothetical protein